MKIYELRERPALLLQKLLNLWEQSVRATHLFLSEAEILRIREYVPQALAGVPHLILAENAAGEPVGVELATASVSSPGIEQYLQLDEAQATQLSRVLPQLIDELAWCELSRRGYLLVEFTQQQCRAQWHQIASVHTTKAEWLAPHQLLIARR